ncbi:MAG: M4 family metallopeptidase [Bacteroidetes bacterium]|nr:M4 family metallopeptidase [Bacteroidota bacterium]MCL1968472.1 M4 family metallopeptidase [Bacteroidota bacterium]
MKKFLLPLLFLTISLNLFAQVSKQEQSAELQKDAKEIKFQEHIGTPSYIHFRDDNSFTHEKVIAYSKGFCAADNVDFTLKSQQQSKDGKIVYKYEQTIAGVPVEFSAWHLHEKNGKIIAVNGDIVNIQNFDVIFSLSEEEALQAALKYVGAEVYMWTDEGEEQNLKFMLEDDAATYYPKGVKIITPLQPDIRNKELTTAYKFNIYSKKPFDRKMVYVDAQTGKILFDLPLIHFDNEIGTAHTAYYGIREINTFSNTPTEFILRDNTRGNGIRTLNCHMTTDYNGAWEFTDDDNDWNNVNPQLDQYATDAHFSTMSTYDYYLNVHNRNSIDGNGFALLSYVHFNLVQAGYGNNVNAFWNGQCMTYGDGNSSYTPLTTMDICGHEITHGVTEKTAGLVYSYESGALNEAFSDILGTCIEFYAVPDVANWLIGEKIGSAFRSMSNPKSHNQPDTYKGQYWATGGGDNGGVHTNSGVLNYWFYLISEGGSGVNDKGNAYQVQGLGIEKAEQIAYKTLTEYLSPSSQYIDAYTYAVIAATDLFGGCTQEVQTVGDAFYAVGVINEPFVSVTSANFKASETAFCSIPATVTFFNKSMNGITYLWNFGDGTTSTETNPVHIYTEEGSYTVTLSVDGGECGSGTITKEHFIIIDASMVCPFNMISGTLNKEGCTGVFYDAGGANGNYPPNLTSTLIIHSSGADKIVLTIEEFDIEPGSGSTCNYDYIEFRDGNSISAPLINNTRYCNTTGNPGTISSTGEYITVRFHSDQGVELAGYKIFFQCQGFPTPPKAHFSTNTKVSCTGMIEFIDNSLNKPVEWLWNFGDGTTSTEQNPVHEYTQSGIYTVSLTVTNEHGTNTIQKDNLITVALPNVPEVGDIKGCNNYEFEINLNLEGTAYWYENITDEEPVYIGNIWNHSPIQENITYYLREVTKAPEGSIDEYCISPFTDVLVISETCLSVAQYNLEKILISPNPSNGLFNIKGLTEACNYRYVVTDITGKIIVENQPLTSKIIDIGGFPDGIYFMTLLTQESVKTYKLVKIK